jgi:hypothetical protein
MIDGALMAALALRSDQAAVLARLGGAVGAAARRRAEELAAMSEVARERAVARELARAASPVPWGLRALHAEWSEALLAAEPEARQLLVDVASGEAPAVARTMSPERVWLLRRAFGALPQRAPDEVEVVAALEELRRWGAAALAAVLGGQRAAVAAALVQLAASDAAAQAAAGSAAARMVGGAGDALRAALREREQALRPLTSEPGNQAILGLVSTGSLDEGRPASLQRTSSFHNRSGEAAGRERAEEAGAAPPEEAGAAREAAGAARRLLDGKSAARACRGVELRSAHALERIGVAAMGDELLAEPLRWLGLCCYVPRAVGMAIARRLT